MKKVGRYVIVSELGRGAMGVVYRASDPTIDRDVALKVLSLSQTQEEGTNSPQEMFMREVRAAGRLAHPSIVTVYDAFDDPVTQSSCIVMELVPGVTLEKMLESGKPPSVEQSLYLIRQVAEALDYAHRNKVIHRDLKPANILVTEDGRAKITDFGIAKVLAREGVARTIGIMGTPSYMSPEQVRGGDIDARTDVFSLGIMIFTMLTGQKPFTGNTAAVMFKIVYEDPALPSTVNTKLSPAHDYVVRKCLAKDRNERYFSIRDLLNDLDDIQNGHSPRSQSMAPTAVTPPEVQPVAEPEDQTSASLPPIPQHPGAKPQPPRMPPPPTPLHMEPPAPRPPAPPPPAAPAPPGPLPRPAQPAQTTPPPAPPARPAVKLPTPPAPLGGTTLVMRVPDLASVSSTPNSPADPQHGTKVPPAPPGTPLLGRTLPMRVPDLNAVSPQQPTTPLPPPQVGPEFGGTTLPMPAPDWPPHLPCTLRRLQHRHRHLWLGLLRPRSLRRSQNPWLSSRRNPGRHHHDLLPPPGTKRPRRRRLRTPSRRCPGDTPAEAAAPSKSKLIPIVVAAAAVVLLAVAGGVGYWKFHKPAVTSPVEEVVKTPPVVPPSVQAPPEALPPAPETPAQPPVTAAKPAPGAAKKLPLRKTKQPAVAHPVPASPQPQPQPQVVTPQPKPEPAAPSPADIAKAEAAKLASAPRIINVVCNFTMKEAKFTFVGGGKTLYQENEKGKKKKSGFLRLKGNYEGSFSHTLTVPAGVTAISVHVESKDGSLDVTNTTKMPSVGGFVPTLSLQVDNDHLTLT